jgi:catechol 2,3-dioxygenase-like lactoylglutathione lyase family enzyme
MDRIRSQGGRTKSEPTRWTVTPEITAWDSLSYDPDGIVLDVFELEPAEGSLMADYDGRCSALQTMALHVSDARRSARFYAALGFRPWYDKLLQNMEGFFKLPPGTALHNINMIIPGQESVGRIEIAQYVGFPGKSLRTVAVPPNTGILGIAMETRDLAATTQLLNSIGAEANSAVVQTTLAHIGSVKAITYYGPDDELLEFFQRLA